MRLWIIHMHHIHHGLSRLVAAFPGLVDPLLLSIFHPVDRIPELPPQDQSRVSSCPLLLQVLLLRGSEIILTRLLCLLDHNLVLFCPPYVQPELDILPDSLCECDIPGVLQDHFL